MALLEGKPMSNVDAAWLHMESPTNLMLISGVMSFYEKLDFAELKELIEDRLLPFERFRQKVVIIGDARDSDRGGSTIPTSTSVRTCRRVALPDPGGQKELQEMVSTVMSTPLDFSKPLWQFLYVENYRGGSAVVAKIHHCIADGIALVRVLLSLTDDSPTGSPKTRRTRRRRKPLGGGFWLPEVVDDAVYSVGRITARMVDRTLETLTDPARAAQMVVEGAKGTGILARLATMPADPQTIFKGELTTAKRVAWSAVMPLADVKAYSKSKGATINDVLLAGVTGAIRRYMIGRKADVDGLNIRAVVPVNLRPDSEIIKLGNRFGLVFLALPVGLADRGERLVELKKRMDKIKKSSEPMVIYAILNAVGLTGPKVESVALQLFGSKATAVMTNVPGPREEIYLAGKAMRSMMFWVPQSARLGLGVSILSYAGQVRLGVATDSGLVPDPESIIEAFHQEMASMMAETSAP